MKRKRKKKTSKAWEGFTVVTISNGTKKAQCNHCKTKLTYGDNGTTSTLKRHLLICKPHKDYEDKQNLLDFTPIRDAGHEKLPSLIRPDEKYDSNKMREAIVTWVLGTEQPFSVVEDDLFVHMMKTATPLFEKTSRTSTKSDCFKIYEHEKKTLKALTKAASKISLTTDCWKSSHQKIEYMVITEHFIDHNWRFDKYWGECHLVMAIASVLDPRFKMKLVEFSFPTIYSNFEKNIEEVKKALYEMYEEYLEIHDTSVREAATPANGCGGNDVSKTTSLGSGWEAFGEFIKNTDFERPEKSELDMYLEECVYRDQGQKGMDSFKALEWWNVHKLKYRALSKMAMDVLAIPISIVASEATFSDGGRVIDPYRSSLAPDTVQKLICGGDWIRHRYGIKKKLKKEEMPIEEMPIEVLLPTGTSNS